MQGDGWFAINQNGQTVYTRDGRMQLSENGALQNVNGAQVLDAGGAPIQLDPDGGEPAISGDGMITQNGRQIGAIGLFLLDSSREADARRQFRLHLRQPGAPVLDFTQNGVVQGAIEGSNVNPIEEMTQAHRGHAQLRQVANEVNKTESSLEDAIKALGCDRMNASAGAPTSRRPSAANALQRLERAVARGLRELPFARVSGVVTEIATSHYRVAGLSRFVRLGECVQGRDRRPRADRRGRAHRGRRDHAEAVRCALRRRDRRARLSRREPVALPARFLEGPRDRRARPADRRAWANCVHGDRAMPLDAEPPPALKRARVKKPIKTGIRVIDLFTPMCAGQRMGVFAGSGVGKSSLLAMLARAPDFDAVVIALVGERGREVREFLEDTLGANRANAVTVVSTGDESPMMRRLAPKAAATIAEYFRDRGQSVLLIVDSVTRFAHAARDVALAAGEPAVARGYAPSVFSDLPRLLERAGPGRRRLGLDHRHLLGAGRRRRPQRSRRRQHSRHARRPYRARPRDRRPGPLSRRQRAGLDLAPRRAALDAGAERAGHAAARR